MKIGIIGSRGIPNRYGGFEELAEKLSIGLQQRGHEVLVYTSSSHPEKNEEYKGVQVVHRWDPENFLGTVGQFIYDFNCIVDCHFKKFDVILQLGYTSSGIWQKLLPTKAKIITNMDGLEWKRSKYTPAVQRFLKRSEKWVTKHSHLLVADHPAIQDYLMEKYVNQVVYIPYGAEILKDPNPEILSNYDLEPFQFNLILARMEPENHISEILEGVARSQSQTPILVVGNIQNAHGKMLRERFRDKRIIFMDGIYDKDIINNLRHFAKFYFHGHSVGGTNPSLLEAMGCGSFIIAHDNPFNRGVLGENALYFSTPMEVAQHIDDAPREQLAPTFIKGNATAIRDNYTWKLIIDQYELAMQQSIIG